MAELISGARSDLAITIYGDDLATLERPSKEIQAAVGMITGASDVRGEQLAGLPTLAVRIDRAAASRYRVTLRDALDAIEVAGGRSVGVVYEGQRRFPLQVRLPPSLREDIEQIRQLPVSGRGGPLIPLAQIASIEIVDSPVSIHRETVRRRTTVEANIHGRTNSAIATEPKPT